MYKKYCYFLPLASIFVSIFPFGSKQHFEDIILIKEWILYEKKKKTSNNGFGLLSNNCVLSDVICIYDLLHMCFYS